MTKPIELSEDEILRQAAIIRGRRGGQATSKKKADASKKSLEKARKLRWPKPSRVTRPKGKKK